MKTKSKILVILLAISGTCLGQIGINREKPDSCAILHINGGNKGVLIEKLKDALENVDKPLRNNLIVVYNNDFYFWDSTANGGGKWSRINSFEDYYRDNTIITYNDIKIIDPNNTDNEIDISRSYGFIRINEYPYYTTTIRPGGTSTIGGNLTVNGVISGYGTIPIGGIIMWSGSMGTWPSNFKLCDGANGTPDLSGSFVIGCEDTVHINTISVDRLADYSSNMDSMLIYSNKTLSNIELSYKPTVYYYLAFIIRTY